jgi:hypothetical protein
MALTGQLAMKGSLNMDSYRIRNVADPVEPQDGVNLRSISFDAIIANSFPGQAVDAGYTIAFTGTGNEGRAVKIAGDLTVPGDNAITTGIDSTANEYNIYIKPDIIDNDNINSAAAIAQSKLAMVAASTRASPSGITQADRGLASFNSAEFTLTSGWAELKTNGIELGKFAQIATIIYRSDTKCFYFLVDLLRSIEYRQDLTGYIVEENNDSIFGVIEIQNLTHHCPLDQHILSNGWKIVIPKYEV